MDRSTPFDALANALSRTRWWRHAAAPLENDDGWTNAELAEEIIKALKEEGWELYKVISRKVT